MAHCSGKVKSWKEIGSVFLHTTQADPGKNTFWLAGPAPLKILKPGVFALGEAVLQVLTAHLS
jgi:hypothetical protein